MKKHANLIKNTTLLNSVSEENIQTSLDNGNFRVVSYGKRCVVHFDGEPCRKLEIILTGKVVVERIDESGNLLAISEFYQDDIIGGNLLFSKNPVYPMTVSTQFPTVILEIDKDILFELLCHDPKVLSKFLELVSNHAYILGDKIRHYVNKTIRKSIMSYLDYECKKQNSNYIKLNISKKSLAESIGVQRTSLSRELAKMKRDGLILFDKDSITLLK